MNKYTLKIYPKGMGREAYRVIEICDKDTLMNLCNIILDSFDFIDEHLYEFCINQGPYCDGNYHREPNSFLDKSANIKLDKLGLSKGQKFILHYDFGDDWMFIISVQKIEPAKKYAKPVVIKKKGEVEQYPDWDEEDWNEDE